MTRDTRCRRLPSDAAGEFELAGKRVRLRPFRPEEFDVVWAVHRAAHRARGRSLKGANQRLRELFRDSGCSDVDVVYLAIEAAGVLVGEVDARRVSPFSPGAFEVGIELYDETRRGKGLGGEAFGLIVSYLFEASSATRVQASTAPGNVRMRRILERHGFIYEGESASRADFVCTRREWQDRKRA
jgi:RimJ/RimL family protein N-acetyltransferase